MSEAYEPTNINCTQGMFFKSFLLSLANDAIPEALDVEQGVYRVSDRFIHPEELYTAGHLADIVFLHGVGGHPIDTWQASHSDESFWPKWLEDDLPGVRVLMIGYRSELAAFQKRGDMAISLRALNVADMLRAYGIGKRPYVFICHSMGGLIAKAIIRSTGTDSSEPFNTSFPRLPKPEGILFMGTPHRGSHLANVLSVLCGTYASSSSVGLRAADPYLFELQRGFMDAAARIHIKIYAEMKPVRTMLGLPGIMVVPLESSAIDGVETVPVDKDHVALPKCTKRTDQVYTGTVEFITHCLALPRIGLATNASAEPSA